MVKIDLVKVNARILSFVTQKPIVPLAEIGKS